MQLVTATVRRVNLGGKALTNYLKELVSYRQWNMMDEYVLMDDVKVGLFSPL
jgi:actin-related protein 6